jgi:hypothetical protein
MPLYQSPATIERECRSSLQRSGHGGRPKPECWIRVDRGPRQAYRKRLTVHPMSDHFFAMSTMRDRGPIRLTCRDFARPDTADLRCCSSLWGSLILNSLFVRQQSTAGTLTTQRAEAKGYVTSSGGTAEALSRCLKRRAQNQSVSVVAKLIYAVLYVLPQILQLGLQSLDIDWRFVL